MNLLAIYGSSRRNGNTEALTKLVLNELDKSCYEEVFLLDYQIKPILDERHSDEGFTPVDDDYEALIEQTITSDALLFATPLYWYGMSGRLKNFIDRWSQSIRSDKYSFKDSMKGKKIYLVVVGGKASPITALPLIQQFQLIAQFMEMEFSGYVIGKGVKPLEVLDDEDSVIAAKQLGKRIKLDLAIK